MTIFINGAICPSSSLTADIEQSTSLVDVISQVKAIKSGGEIVVYINSPGGYVDEGFAIYDYLRNLGRPIKTIAIEQCASIASVVFLAGDVRIANCDIMIHNPWSYAEGDAEQVKLAVEELAAAEVRLEKFYAERLGIDVDTISSLMRSTTYIAIEQAVALGFATTAQSATAPLAMLSIQKAKSIKTKNELKMKQTTKRRVINILDAVFGSDALNMEFTTADGATFTVEREDGEPAVGDAASPDGEFVMPDGATIVVAGGVITEIIPAQDDEPTTEEQLALANARIAQLEAQVPTIEDKAVLDAVKAMGGGKVLSKVCSAYIPATRVDKKEGPQAKVPGYQKQLDDIKNKRKNG